MVVVSTRAKIFLGVGIAFIVFVAISLYALIRQNDFKACINIRCPDDEPGGTPGPSTCPSTIPQFDLTTYINNLPPFVPSDGGRPSDTILSLVAIAENSSTDWQKQINYIEDIKDGRGFTISIVGFCTGTGDFKQVVQRVGQLNPAHPLVQFLPALEAVDKTACHNGLENLPTVLKSLGTTDPVFNQAVFELTGKLYWSPAVQYAAARNMTSLLAQYIMYDTNLNFGSLQTFNTVTGTSEQEYLNNFLDVKQCLIRRCRNLGNAGFSVTGKNNRVDMQRSLLTKGNYNLASPMSLNCYGDSYTL